MDNSIAVVYVNIGEGTKSSTLAELAVELWAVCHWNNIWITAQHLPGTQNVDADWASRHFNKRTEWTLDKSIFKRIVRKFYTPEVDLFASRLNHQLPKYVSRHPHPEAMSVDAMTLQWNKWISFIHPPAHSNASSHPEEDSGGPGDLSAHCPKLGGTDMVSTPAAVVDRHPSDFANVGAHNIFTIQPIQARHPLWRTLKLAVWPLSGDAVKQEAFHHRCATYSWPPGEMEQRKDTKVPVSYGVAGVCQGIPVHFQPL